MCSKTLVLEDSNDCPRYFVLEHKKTLPIYPCARWRAPPDRGGCSAAPGAAGSSARFARSRRAGTPGRPEHGRALTEIEARGFEAGSKPEIVILT